MLMFVYTVSIGSGGVGGGGGKGGFTKVFWKTLSRGIHIDQFTVTDNIS